MKSSTARNILYGCLFVWMLAAIFGGATSTQDYAMQRTGAILCPENTTPGSTTFTQMVRDSNGISHPSVAHRLQCKDASGAVVMEDDIKYGLLWGGIFLGAAIVLTAPILLGVLISVLAGRSKNKKLI